MIFYYCIMTDVISAPERDVVSDLNERLNCVVFKNEAVVADGMLG